MKKSYYLAAVAVLAAVAAVVTAQLPRADAPRIPELPPVVAAPNSELPKPIASPSATPQPPKLPTVPPPNAALPGTPALPNSPKLPALPSPLTSNPNVPQEPLSNPRPLPSVPPPTTVAGTTPPTTATQTLTSSRQFVVLKDDKLIEGQVSQTEEKVLVRQGTLDRPFSKVDVQFVGSTKDEVYRFMVGKAAAADPLARLKVAKWCLYNGMRSQALAEAREVVKLDPKNTSAAQMVRTLEESLQKFPEDGAPAAAPTAPQPKTPTVNPMRPTLPPVPPPTIKEPPPIPLAVPPPIPPAIPNAVEVAPDADVTPEAAAAFASRIQPILANLCAECHAKPDHTSTFKLARTTAYDSSPDTALPNMKAVARQLNKTDPAKSPLLVKAATAHGGMKKAVFVGRSPAAYRNLEAWAYAAIGSIAQTPATTEPIAKTVPPANPLPLTSTPAVVLNPLPPVSTPSTFGQEAKPLPPPGVSPTNAGEPVDDFDPSVFNRLMSPTRR